TYCTPLRMGGHKEYSDPFNTFTCCVGSGMENHVKYGESIYSRGSDGSLYVNLFIPSRLSWKEKRITVVQHTLLPREENTELTIGTSHPETFTLRIRKPHWSGPVRLTVNGAPVAASVGEDGYLHIRRTWRDGDKIEARFPESFYTMAIPDNPARIALFYGPVLLAGELGDKEPDPVKGIPVLVSQSRDPNQWVHRLADKDRLVFRTSAVGHPEDVTLIPFNRTENEYYSVYWDYFSPAAWAIEQEKYAAGRKRGQELEDRTIDRVRLGEMQPERDHAFTGEGMEVGDAHGRKWRSAENGGWFSFVIKVDSSAGNTLLCSYWGDDHRGRTWDIQVDGQTIATQNLTTFKQSKFYDIGYPIPRELVMGKQTVTVKFVARNKHTSVGPVSGVIRMVRR